MKIMPVGEQQKVEKKESGKEVVQVPDLFPQVLDDQLARFCLEDFYGRFLCNGRERAANEMRWAYGDCFH